VATRALLLQARRPDDPVAGEERASFAARLGPSIAIDTHDLLAGPPEWAALEPYDLVMIGGSGDYYVSKGNLPQFDLTLEFFRRVAKEGFPTFASCFGFQCLVAALGGEIGHDPANTEVGTYELWLTEEGRTDPVLGGLPDHFPAQMGRKDRALSLPDGVIHLASSERCPYQAFRIPGRPTTRIASVSSSTSTATRCT
jgi:GMP synthase (glutamine-hydrolysing)